MSLITRSIKYLVLLLLLNSMAVMADDNINSEYKTLVLDIQITGDSTVTGDLAENKVKIAKFSKHLRNELDEKTQLNVIQNEQSLEQLEKASENLNLHNCNGCEMTIAKELGAELVFIPTVFRMSHYISSLRIEIKDVETDELIKRKAFDFRGNTDKAWEMAIKYAVRDLKDWDRN